MTAKAYLLCDVLKFSVDEYSVPIQESLIEYEGEPEITIKLARTDYYNGFDQYTCHHDFKIKVYGKAFNRPFNYYFRPTDFYLFYNRDLHLALISVRSKIGLDFIDNLNGYKKHEFAPIEIDFDYILPRVREMTGVWISKINHTNLKTAGYFGNHVNKSKEFEEATKEGKISSAQIKYTSPITQEEHTIGISKKGTITLYDSFNQLEDELEIILSVYNNIIKKPN